MPVTLKYRPGGSAAPPSGPATPRRAGFPGWLRLVAVVALIAVLGLAALTLFFYEHYKGIVDQRLAAGPLFAPVTRIYAAAREVRPGQTLSARDIAADLRRAGYAANSPLGTYELRDADSIFIKPGPESFHSPDGATITTADGAVTSINAENGAPLAAYQLEPQLISSLSEDKSRTKRRLVTYNDIPPQMVQAVLAIEDRRFFQHPGINVGRTVKCGLQDLVSAHMSCGGSTLTQQLARGFFLSPEKRLKRKFIEILISFQLEHRFTKEQIFEMYANEINLGQRGTFAINGFGEAAETYFGRDLKQLSLAQEALLAGLIQSPSRLNPYRHPERALTRRNLVLSSMVETGAITEAQARAAQAEPLRLSPQQVSASEAPYFIDLVHDQLSQRLSEQEQTRDSLRIYTSLDPDLQRVAGEAVEVGMRHVDELVAHRKGDSDITPQVALVALNPHTGQVLALVGGRNYNTSQLDHAISKRPTGSIFKPWVYATAFNTSLNGTVLGDPSASGGAPGPFTANTLLNDDPQYFQGGYHPNNFSHGEFPGLVTASTAIEHSLNIATVALAQQVGFSNVAALARASGISGAQGTPAVALGSYDATPLDMAGAYTVFANGGVHLNPWFIASVRNNAGDIVSDFTPQASQVMDPRAAYLTQSLLEGVMARGTGAAARSRGFGFPAAGKTGTSHDVWFAGYTTNLLCIIWVGNDDYTDVKLQGATAAAPIWGEFMKRAQKLPQYSDMKGFPGVSGVSTVRLDKTSHLLADGSCPETYTAAFLDGTAPTNTCSSMAESPENFVNRIFSTDPSPYQKPTDPYSTPNTPPNPNQPQPTNPEDTTNPDGTPRKRRNFFQKLFGTGKDNDSNNTQPPDRRPSPQ